MPTLSKKAKKAWAGLTRIYDNEADILFQLAPDVKESVHRAYGFAAWRHRTMRRKGAMNRPFIHHPTGVWYLCYLAGGSKSDQKAAFLHDTVEDAHELGDRRDVVVEAIRQNFGEKTTKKVVALTNKAGLAKKDKRPWQMAHYAKQPKRVRLIKACDMTAKLVDCCYDNYWAEAKLKSFIAFVDAYYDMCPELPAFMRELKEHAKAELHKQMANGTLTKRPYS